MRLVGDTGGEAPHPFPSWRASVGNFRGLDPEVSCAEALFDSEGDRHPKREKPKGNPGPKLIVKQSLPTNASHVIAKTHALQPTHGRLGWD